MRSKSWSSKTRKQPASASRKSLAGMQLHRTELRPPTEATSDFFFAQRDAATCWNFRRFLMRCRSPDSLRSWCGISRRDVDLDRRALGRTVAVGPLLLLALRSDIAPSDLARLMRCFAIALACLARSPVEAAELTDADDGLLLRWLLLREEAWLVLDLDEVVEGAVLGRGRLFSECVRRTAASRDWATTRRSGIG